MSEPEGAAQRRQAMLYRLADPRLTGMSTAQLQQLVITLAPARTQQRHSQQRGGLCPASCPSGSSAAP
ncbi:hypothetical protein [Sphaerisporangium perillae]|uniref:hypothetical protein n=1 Tax=Sphaerisporangium perillae TaxID=2935860 RepID=UPI00200BE1DF|nr:hypothetical protein [Sphaerisporangium perillae]